MTQLGTEALEMLRGAGITAIDWARAHGGGDRWRGDACGCPDDRCIGYHHGEQDPCGCLPVLVESHLDATG